VLQVGRGLQTCRVNEGNEVISEEYPISAGGTSVITPRKKSHLSGGVRSGPKQVQADKDERQVQESRLRTKVMPKKQDGGFVRNRKLRALTTLPGDAAPCLRAMTPS